MHFPVRVVENHPQNSCLLFSATKKSIPHHSPESTVENRRLGDRDLTLLPYTHERSLAVDLLLWLEDQSFEELAWGIFERGGLVR